MSRALLIVFAAILLGNNLAFAHHSPIVFDRSKKVALTGTVTEFKWGNPHSWIHLDVKDESGTMGNWGIEMNPANNLVREGWRSSTLKPGDEVTIVVHPLRNNEKGGQFLSITLPDGTVLGGERESGVL
jgi:Family of unknown function (DUF6152)